MRLSYKDQRLYEVLPDEIAQIEQEIKAIEGELSNPSLYAENEKKFYELSQKLETLRISREEKENKWLELEMQKNQ